MEPGTRHSRGRSQSWRTTPFYARSRGAASGKIPEAGAEIVTANLAASDRALTLTHGCIYTCGPTGRIESRFDQSEGAFLSSNDPMQVLAYGVSTTSMSGNLRSITRTPDPGRCHGVKTRLPDARSGRGAKPGDIAQKSGITRITPGIRPTRLPPLIHGRGLAVSRAEDAPVAVRFAADDNHFDHTQLTRVDRLVRRRLWLLRVDAQPRPSPASNRHRMGFLLSSHAAGEITIPLRINTRKLFRGEVRAGRAVGFHHRGTEATRTQVILPLIRGPNAQGVFEARVRIWDSRTRKWIAKAKSTFFPDAWSRTRVLGEINHAYANSLTTANGWEGVGTTGVPIVGYFDDRGVLDTAFPIFVP
jgi:hypothetical protein